MWKLKKNKNKKQAQATTFSSQIHWEEKCGFKTKNETVTFRLFLSICMFLPVDQVRLYTPVCLDCAVLIKWANQFNTWFSYLSFFFKRGGAGNFSNAFLTLFLHQYAPWHETYDMFVSLQLLERYCKVLLAWQSSWNLWHLLAVTLKHLTLEWLYYNVNVHPQKPQRTKVLITKEAKSYMSLLTIRSILLLFSHWSWKWQW